jgi:protein O-mannosyl-transferase
LPCALAALIYQNGLDNPFVFDDREAILLNPSFINPWDWRAALLGNPSHPVLALSFALDRALWGFSSFGFHITNVVLHIICVGLFYGWCTRVLRRDGRLRAAGATEPSADWAAFFAAAMFALHPVMSSAVEYISARSELLGTAAFIASLTYTRRAIVGNNRNAAILAAIFAALAIGSSSSAATLPLIALAYDAWVLRDPRWPLRLARVYAPATLAIFSIAAWRLTASVDAVVPPRGPIVNLLSEARVVWRYLGLLVLPRGQSLVHDVQWTSAFDPGSIVAMAALAAAVVFAIRVRRIYPLAAFGVVWFAGVLAPTSSFIPLRDGMAEHRLYLAAPGLLLALASVAWRTIASRRVVQIALTCILAILAAGTYRRNEVWSNSMDLWEESVRRAPNAWQAHWGRAELLRELGRCDLAKPEYDAVLRLYPDYAGARAGLDRCLP